jgi:hypothetical protein
VLGTAGKGRAGVHLTRHLLTRGALTDTQDDLLIILALLAVAPAAWPAIACRACCHTKRGTPSAGTQRRQRQRGVAQASTRQVVAGGFNRLRS